MKKSAILFIFLNLLLISISYCQTNGFGKKESFKVRPLKDSIGFAQYSWQMDSLMSRMDRIGWKKSDGLPWKLAICPHDDYTYVGTLYPELLQNIKAPNLILIGVAHKAAQFGIEDSLVFDSYSNWKGPWKDVLVSDTREEIYNLLSKKFAIVNDSLQKVEHSVEALIPFLQYFNRNISIVPILVPAMSSDRMKECGKALADAIRIVAQKHKWEWGSDFAIVVTTDAVHYGNEDWGGADRAYFGCDEKGNVKARDHESEIIKRCLEGNVGPENLRLFSSYTLNPSNFREYKWTWCGRYSVPVALYTSYYLNGSQPLTGELIGYATSITSVHIPVDDIRMGRTAIATDCHWVGYAALGYRVENNRMYQGLVTISVINLRKQPDHRSELVSQAILGTPVLILKDEDSWLLIQTPDNYIGWTEKNSVRLMNVTEMNNWKKANRVIYLRNSGWIYNGITADSGTIGDLVAGCIMEKTGESKGYIDVLLPDGRKGFVNKKETMEFDIFRNQVKPDEEKVIKFASSLLGVPYLWGGTSTKGVDCSGFVQTVFFMNGLILMRDASLQALHGEPVDISNGFSQLRKGDLLFFGSKENGNSHITHVAIYKGNNEYINSSGRVLINSLDSSSTDYSRYRLHSLLAARRVIGVENDPGIVPLVRHLWY